MSLVFFLFFLLILFLGVYVCVLLGLLRHFLGMFDFFLFLFVRLGFVFGEALVFLLDIISKCKGGAWFMGVCWHVM